MQPSVPAASPINPEKPRRPHACSPWWHRGTWSRQDSGQEGYCQHNEVFKNVSLSGTMSWRPLPSVWKVIPGCAGHCVTGWSVASVRGLSEAMPPLTSQIYCPRFTAWWEHRNTSGGLSLKWCLTDLRINTLLYVSSLWLVTKLWVPHLIIILKLFSFLASHTHVEPVLCKIELIPLPRA